MQMSILIQGMLPYLLEACAFGARKTCFITEEKSGYGPVNCHVSYTCSLSCVFLPFYYYCIFVLVSAKFNLQIHIRDRHFNSISDVCSIQVKYLGSKPYNQSFIHEGIKQAHKSTTYTVKGLVPGSFYKFEVYGNSICRDGAHSHLPSGVKTEMAGEH